MRNIPPDEGSALLCGAGLGADDVRSVGELPFTTKDQPARASARRVPVRGQWWF
jgi:hypothetical protein